MKKRSLKAPFVVTFASSAAVLAGPGCSSEFTSNPPPTTGICPDTPPNSGEACSSPGLSCSYDPCVSPSFTCSSNGAWEADYVVSCNPPPVLECPQTIPMHGEASCFGEGTCDYTDECGLPITASCPGGTWEVMSQGTCNPPAPCDLFGTADKGRPRRERRRARGVASPRASRISIRRDHAPSYALADPARRVAGPH